MTRAPRLIAGRSRAGAALLAVLALGSAACGSGSQASGTGSAGDSPSVADSGSASPSATTTSSSGPTTGPTKPDGLPTDYPQAGFKAALPPATRPATRAALQTYLAFENVTRTSFRTATVPASLSRLAAPSLVQQYQASAAYMRRTGTRFRGTTTATVRGITGTARLAVLTVCLDSSETKQVVKGTPKPLDGLPRQKLRVVLNHPTARWVVTEYKLLDAAC